MKPKIDLTVMQNKGILFQFVVLHLIYADLN